MKDDTKRSPDPLIDIEWTRQQALGYQTGLRDWVLHDLFRRTGNPLCAWEAIKICRAEKRPLPAWVLDYLGACADRMLSGETAPRQDFRSVLPEVMGFAGRRGPRAIADAEELADREAFSHIFTLYLMDDEAGSIEDILDRARLALPAKDAARDYVTLMRWIAEYFRLDAHPTGPCLPRTVSTWRKALGLEL
jgi:hypothetical protein